MVEIAVRSTHVQVEDAVENAVGHAVNDGGGVEFWREGPPELLPVLVESVGTVLPSLHHIAGVKHGKDFQTVQECVDGPEMVIGQVTAPAADLRPVVRAVVEEFLELGPIHLAGHERWKL